MTKADPQHPGLTLRARRGVLSWEFWYTRPNTGGARGRKVLGRYPEMDLEGARDRAAEERRKVKAGLDLSIERLIDKSGGREEVDFLQDPHVTVEKACKAYLADLQKGVETGSRRGRKKTPKKAGFHGARRAFENHVYRTIGSIPLATLEEHHITTLLIEKMTTEDPKVKKHSQCNRVLSSLHAAVNYAIRNNKAVRQAVNNANVVPRNVFTEEKKTRKALTTEELARFGQTIDKMETEKRLHRSAALAFRFLVLTGFRRSELLGHLVTERRSDKVPHGLRWQDVDLEKGVIRLRDTKTGPQDRVIGSAAIELLRKAKASTIHNGPEDPVCPGTKTEVYGGIATARDPLWKEAKLDKQTLTIHSLRHTFATVASHMEMRKYVGFVSELLGHAVVETSSRITENTYVHPDISVTRIAADAISERIAAIMRGEIETE